MTDLTIIAYTAEGYEIRFQAEANNIAQVLNWVRQQGLRPRQGFEWTPEGLPICPKHGTPMAKREKQGDTWYSHNISADDEIYCRGYPGKSSPGWDYGSTGVEPLPDSDQRYYTEQKPAQQSAAAERHRAANASSTIPEPDPDPRPKAQQPAPKIHNNGSQEQRPPLDELLGDLFPS